MISDNLPSPLRQRGSGTDFIRKAGRQEEDQTDFFPAFLPSL
jgi:hypothetical protein